MNLYSYIDKYGNNSFDDLKFNEVDNIIFSSIVYADISNYVSKSGFNKKTIKEVGDLFFSTYDKREKNVIAIKNGIKVLKYIKDTKRYGNLLLYNYCKHFNENEQFCAVTIEINKHLNYVAFQGTDGSIAGWRENGMMGYKYPILSQRRAVSYLNKFFFLSRKNLILGGHSKGGNLAIAGGMGASNYIKNKIINIYSNDGPGFKIEQIESKDYQSISDKVIHIVPNYSFFGLMFNHTGENIVIKSTKKSIIAHAMQTWVVEDKKLMRADLSEFSIKLNNVVFPLQVCPIVKIIVLPTIG